MKYIVLIFIIVASVAYKTFSTPEEGMWIPLLLKDLNEEDMQRKGLKLSASDIYDVNKSCIKDAVVSFGGFCTGEIISSEGLLITNHHCGYGEIQSHSSVEKDYLTNGFWAMSKAEELTNPGLTATFIIRIEDVTEKVLAGINDKMTKKEKEDSIAVSIKKIEKEAIDSGSHFEAKIKSFYYGNEYYMFITETFKDVRLAGAPPSSIGKFGGDTDNWMWPRHTGDFSMFRIYANSDNKPAEYSKENKPYKPKHFLPVSLNGINKGDFTMVFGFPGLTQEYLTSYAVKLITQVSNPAKIKIRKIRLAIMDADMKTNAETRIKYAAKYASVSNGYKKWIGENKGLNRFNAISKKQLQEDAFTAWINNDTERKLKYGAVLPELKSACDEQSKVQSARDYYFETILYGIEIISYANQYFNLVKTLKENNSDSTILKTTLKKLIERTDKHFKNYNLPTDKNLFVTLLKMYKDDIDSAFHPAIFSFITKNYNDNFNKYADFIFKKSIFVSKEKALKILNQFNNSSMKKVTNDPAYQLMLSFVNNYKEKIESVYDSSFQKINQMNKLYITGLREMYNNKKFYPDANGTMRISYGKVDDYYPSDGVFYKHYTTLDGIIQKADSLNEDFIVPKKLIEIHKTKDYGQYGKDNEMPVCFIASNHTTGGNSGSPILNANGQLIGINFDRNWEGTMSDIMYDPDRVRNIGVDIRYVLFVIDKFAGAKHLIEEMTIISNP